MAFSSVVVGLKEGVGHEPLLELISSAVPSGSSLYLVTLVKVGNDGDEPRRLQAAEGILEQHASRLRQKGYDVSLETGLVAAAAGVDLLRIANQQRADLIVIGLAKRSRVGKALMGSDAQRVLLGAGCPVLTTRTTAECERLPDVRSSADQYALRGIRSPQRLLGCGAGDMGPH
jgi:nucleotide-binding universal stress UspA family protein